MLGEILTAIVTPFKADGSVDIQAFRALAAHLVDERLGRPRRDRDDGRVADALRRRALRAVRGRRRRGRRPRDRRRRHGDLLDRALGAPDGARARARRARLPRRDAVLQQASGARDRRATSRRSPPSPTGRSSSTTSPAGSSSTSRPEAIAQLAEIPTVRAVKQANPDLEQARAIVELGLDLYAGDDDLVFPFLELGGIGRRVRAHARRRPAGEGDGARASATATSRARARSTRSCARRSTSCASSRTRSRSSAR